MGNTSGRHRWSCGIKSHSPPVVRWVGGGKQRPRTLFIINSHSFNDLLMNMTELWCKLYHVSNVCVKFVFYLDLLEYAKICLIILSQNNILLGVLQMLFYAWLGLSVTFVKNIFVVSSLCKIYIFLQIHKTTENNAYKYYLSSKRITNKYM